MCIFHSIEKKKDIYDKYGEEGLKQGAGGVDAEGGGTYTFQGNPHEIFSQMFGGSNPFGDLFGSSGGSSFSFAPQYSKTSFGGLRGGRAASGGYEEMDFSPYGNSIQQDKDVEHNLNLTLEELHQGCKKRMKISRQVLSADGNRRTEEKIVEIDVKPGWKNGTKIRFPKEGDQFPGRKPADIVFVVKEKPHKLFQRDGNNLIFTARISLKDALCGVSVPVQCIDKTVKTIHFKDVVSPETVHTLSGCGMPLSKNPSRCGDLIVKFNIRFPSYLKLEDKTVLKKILT